MAQKSKQRHTVCWYSDEQLVRMSKVADGARLRQYFPGATDRSFCCWELQDAPGNAFDFRTPVHADLCLTAVYAKADEPGEGRFVVGAGCGSLLASHWQQTEALRMIKTDTDTYEISLMLYRGDTLQFKKEGTWRGQIGITGLVPAGDRERFCFFGKALYGDITVMQSGEYAFVWKDGQEPSVTVTRLADAPACTEYTEWYVVGEMNEWQTREVYRLHPLQDTYTAEVEIPPSYASEGCRFMLHNPKTGQYLGASDGGHLRALAGKYRITAELPLGGIRVESLEVQEEESNVI